MDIGWSLVDSLKTLSRWRELINANVNGAVQAGFKSASITWGDLNQPVSTPGTAATGGLGINIPGLGLKVLNTRINWEQGQPLTTSEWTNFAINGEGFFLTTNNPNMSDPDTKYYYTRDGNFRLDEEGFLRTADGLYVLDGSIVPGDPINKAASLPPWNPAWMAYDFREGIGVRNKKNYVLTDRNIVELTIDTKKMVEDGIIQPDGKDIRIGMWDGTNWHNVPFDMENFNTEATVLRFRVSPTSADNDLDPSEKINNKYYLYYGVNPVQYTAPNGPNPADPPELIPPDEDSTINQVVTAYMDFEDPGYWSSLIGTGPCDPTGGDVTTWSVDPVTQPGFWDNGIQDTPSVFWNLDDASYGNGFSRPPGCERSPIPAGEVNFIPGVGYTWPATPDKLYKYYDDIAAKWRVGIFNPGTEKMEPTLMTYASKITEKPVPDLSLNSSNFPNGWSILDLDALMNGTAYADGIVGTPPALSGVAPTQVAGKWGYQSGVTFYPYDNPLFGKPSSISSIASQDVTNAVWGDKINGNYLFVTKELITVNPGDVYVDGSDEFNLGTISFSGGSGDPKYGIDDDVTIYLRKPDGTRVLIYDDLTPGPNDYDSGPAELKIKASNFNLEGKYYIEVFASNRVFDTPINVSQYWDDPDNPPLTPSRPPYQQAALPAGNIVFSTNPADQGYTAVDRFGNPTAGEKLYKYFDGTNWKIVREDLTEPTMEYLTTITPKNIPNVDLSLNSTNFPNGWNILDLDALMNGTAYADGLVGNPPTLSGNHAPVFEGGKWGYYTTWGSSCIPPQPDFFIPFDEPDHGRPTSIVASDSGTVANSVWSNTDGHYFFINKKIFTVGPNDVYTDLAGEFNAQIKDSIRFFGSTDQDVTIFLRKPDGTRVKIYDDVTDGANDFDSDPAPFDDGDPYRLSNELKDPGDYYIEVFASCEVFSTPSVAPYYQPFTGYSNQLIYQGPGAPVSWGDGWTFGGLAAAPDNARWEIADEPSWGPGGGSGKVLYQTRNSNAYGFRGDENWKDYKFECTIGKADSDDDELRWWVRVNSNGTNQPAAGNGYMLFFNGGGGDSWCGVPYPQSDRISSSEIFGITRWIGDSDPNTISNGTTLISNKQNEHGNGGLTIKVNGSTTNQMAIIEDWLGENRFYGGGDLAYYRVRAITEGDKITFRISPKNSENVDAPLGTGNGNALEIEIIDPVNAGPGGACERGKFALQNVSQVAWYDQVRFEPIWSAQNRGIRIDGPPANEESLDYINTAGAYKAVTTRYEVRNDAGVWKVYDKFGDGYDTSTHSDQMSNKNDIVGDGDDFRFKDYIPNLATGAIAVDALDHVPTLPGGIVINYTAGDQKLDFINTADILTTDRYEIDGTNVWDKFGDGYNASGGNGHSVGDEQLSNIDNNPWGPGEADNFAYKDYIINPNSDKIKIERTNNIPVYAPGIMKQNQEYPGGETRVKAGTIEWNDYSFDVDFGFADGSHDHDVYFYARYRGSNDWVRLVVKPGGGPNNLVLEKCDDGVITQLATATYNFTDYINIKTGQTSPVDPIPGWETAINGDNGIWPGGTDAGIWDPNINDNSHKTTIWAKRGVFLDGSNLTGTLNFRTDNEGILYVNGTQVAIAKNNWAGPDVTVDISPYLKPGMNVIGYYGTDSGGLAGFYLDGTIAGSPFDTKGEGKWYTLNDTYDDPVDGLNPGTLQNIYDHLCWIKPQDYSVLPSTSGKQHIRLEVEGQEIRVRTAEGGPLLISAKGLSSGQAEDDKLKGMIALGCQETAWYDNIKLTPIEHLQAYNTGAGLMQPDGPQDVLDQMRLMNFPMKEGLRYSDKWGASRFMETDASGDPFAEWPGTNGMGKLSAFQLETSNTDLGGSLIELGQEKDLHDLLRRGLETWCANMDSILNIIK